MRKGFHGFKRICAGIMALALVIGLLPVFAELPAEAAGKNYRF